MKLYTTPLIGMLCSALVIGNSYAGTFVASKSYVDNKDATQKTYIDTQDTATLNSAKAYANAQDTATLATLKHTSGSALNAQTTAVTNVTQTNGVVTVQKGTLTSAAISDKDSTNVVTSTNTGKIPTVGGVQAGIAKQGSATVDWTAVTDSTSGASAQLKDAKTNQDNYVPTVKAVETRIKTIETSLSANIDAKEDKSNKVTSIGSTNTDTQYPSAKAVYDVMNTMHSTKQNKNDSKVEGTKGTDFHYITAGNAVGNNLKALDIQVKTNADAINTKANKATTLAGYNIGDAYTKSETDTKLGTKADKGTTLAAYGITNAYTKADVYTKSETNTELAKKEDKSNKIDSNQTWETVATSSTKDTSYPTVAAVEARVNTAETSLSANINAKADKATTLAGYGITDAYTKTQTDTELAKKVAKNADITASTKNSVVTYDAKGLVTGGFQLENGGIKSIENADSATLCSTTNPCILTYLGGTGAAADYRWTPMDESTETIPAKSAS